MVVGVIGRVVNAVNTYGGFFPTAILTVLDVPERTSTALTLSGDSGDIWERRTRVNMAAALSSDGNFSTESDCKKVRDSEESTEACTPTLNPTGTANPSSLPYTLIAGKPGGPFTFFQPACCKDPSIAFSRSIDSESWNTEENAYSVSLNCSRAETSSDTLVSDLGVLIRLTPAAASDARCWASAARLWASANNVLASVANAFASRDCTLAEFMSFSNESASLLAPRARVNALPDAASADCDLLNASAAFETAESESAMASLAFPSASCALVLSSEMAKSCLFACARASSSLRSPYGNAMSSMKAANKKDPTTNLSNSFPCVGLRCLINSHPAHTTNPIIDVNSRSRWAVLTNSDESQPGRSVIHSLLAAWALSLTFLLRLVNYAKSVREGLKEAVPLLQRKPMVSSSMSFPAKLT